MLRLHAYLIETFHASRSCEAHHPPVFTVAQCGVRRGAIARRSRRIPDDSEPSRAYPLLAPATQGCRWVLVAQMDTKTKPQRQPATLNENELQLAAASFSADSFQALLEPLLVSRIVGSPGHAAAKAVRWRGWFYHKALNQPTLFSTFSGP